MNNHQLTRRLNKLEQQQATGDCHCQESACFVSPADSSTAICGKCGRRPFRIVVAELPRGSTIQIPVELIAALRQALTRDRRIDLRGLDERDLQSLESALQTCASS
jgi:hypothetical protein